MSSNVGLSTPRGSGTSGYVQRNLSHLKPRDNGPYPAGGAGAGAGAGANAQPLNEFKQRKPDRKILEHDRRRAIEVRLLEERERLEEMGEEGGAEGEDEKGGRVILSEEEIEERIEVMRKRLVRELEEELAGGDGGGVGKGGVGGVGKGRRQFKSYQVHELAEAKIQESERLRRALGIRGEGEEGGDWRGGSGAGAGAGSRGWGDRYRGGEREDGRDGGRERERERERYRERDGDRERERKRDGDRDRYRDRDDYRGRSRRD
ncbi:RNA-splicing factor [Onygenales sp. PD_12]|nr:RNA-splicing factor [Onygenales sp. PD_12]